MVKEFFVVRVWWMESVNVWIVGWCEGWLLLMLVLGYNWNEILRLNDDIV